MAKLEEISRGCRLNGVLAGSPVEVVDVQWQGTSALAVVYRDSQGRTGDVLLLRSQEPTIEVINREAGRRPFDADGARFRLVSEAYRIQLAYVFDPLLAVHTSLVEPLPHQITAVYEEMLPRQPLKFLLADDPGAGKTIMAGLLMKELIVRGDLKRCLICCPGSLVEQWQEEMATKFHLAFQPVTNDLIEADLSGNPFATFDFVIARLDHMSRSEEIQAKLRQTEWDLIVCDEAHKMSCPWYGNEPKPTKRYNLGKLLSTITRHFLLLTATPHNGKEEDFQSFLQLIDPDRFEGRGRSGQKADASDLIRRLVKEDLLKFDETPLFPERLAYAPLYDLTPQEYGLYKAVTHYVSTEMNRVERLQRAGQGKRGAIVGFAMVTLQRRLASSPEAIYQSIRRRRENLGERLKEIEAGRSQSGLGEEAAPAFDVEEGDEEDLSDDERERLETEVLTHSTASQTIEELEREIETLKSLEDQTQRVRNSKEHGKWNELARTLQEQPELFDAQGHRRKLIIFTEYRDTLNYLATRIRSLIGKPDAVVTIHGGMSRDERRFMQNAFVQNKDVLILVATDAAGEGVNLQRAHLMINFDLPWNPNRLEQRFGRIHRIGQTEVCHMWNLVAKDTREGDVFQHLFARLEEERRALGGRVFDVLGRAIEAKELRDLLMEAVRYGDKPEVRARLFEKVKDRLDHKHLQGLLEERALAQDTMDVSRIRKIKEEMERAEARKLQPHFIQTFFLKAFRETGGTIHEREPRRFEITHVPAAVRNRDALVARGLRLQTKYERITFEKDLIQVAGKPTAEFVCPGHPLLDVILSLTYERNKDALERGAILVDPADDSSDPRALWYLQGEILDGRADSRANRRTVWRQMYFVEMSAKHEFRNAGYAPYLDYRPLDEKERLAMASVITPSWLSSMTQDRAIEYASSHILSSNFEEVRKLREENVERTRRAVKDRLTKEINYWDRRANDLKEKELQGKKTTLSSGNARRRADDLQARLNDRMAELDREKQLILRPPGAITGAIIVPQGLLDKAMGLVVKPPTFAKDRDRVERLAMDAVQQAERRIGREPRDVSAQNLGYDVESRDPRTSGLFFLEVKGRARDADTITVTRNEILTGLNKPEAFILAIVIVDEGGASEPRYVRKPFKKDPDWDAVSVNYDLASLLKASEVPS